MKLQKAKKEISKDTLKEETLVKKIIDSFLWYQVEESDNMIKKFGNEIKLYENKKKLILNNCIFSFQREKAYKEMTKIDEKIFELYEKIGEEVRMIEQVKNSIDRGNIFNKGSIEKANELLSYYDLLSFLKRGIVFKKVSLNEFDKEIFYIYDNEGNYIIEDKTKIGSQFTAYLGEFASDNNKFKKNIKIMEK